MKRFLLVALLLASTTTVSFGQLVFRSNEYHCLDKFGKLMESGYSSAVIEAFTSEKCFVIKEDGREYNFRYLSNHSKVNDDGTKIAYFDCVSVEKQVKLTMSFVSQKNRTFIALRTENGSTLIYNIVTVEGK